jgi:hypothetical protein
MTLKPWLARALRRFLGTAVMAVGGQAFIHALLFPPPVFPPADADRITVQADGSDREIRDPATVRRALAIVRAQRGREWTRYPEIFHLPSDGRIAYFHRGQQVQGRFVWNPAVLILETRHHYYVIFRLTPSEAAELDRLLGSDQP